MPEVWLEKEGADNVKRWLMTRYYPPIHRRVRQKYFKCPPKKSD
jgi:hypothetical protein